MIIFLILGLIVLAMIHLLAIFAYPSQIGKVRKPITAEQATGYMAYSVVIIVLLVTSAVSLA